MNEITFRRAAPEDAAVLTDMRIRFAIELSGDQDPAAIAGLGSSIQAYFREATENGSCISIIAEDGPEPVGIGTVHLRQLPGSLRNPSGRWGYIMNMYTDPGYRMRGICGRILQLLEDAGREAGITAFELHATAQGEPVYLKHGFRIHGEPTLRKLVTARDPG